MAAGNFSFAVNAFCRWAPATLWETAEERVVRLSRDERARERRRRRR
jgi:hypothetical protein